MRFARWLLLTAALLLSGTASRADDPIGMLSFGASGGMSFYALGDVNDRIEGDGNAFLTEMAWTLLDPLRFGWSFCSDLKVELPLGEREVMGLPLKLFLGGGYGVSSGETGGKDYNELTSIKVSQESLHLRLLYVLPWRPQDDVRLFVGGGPVILPKQEVTASHTRQREAGGGTGSARVVERTEEITYSGSGVGWQFGLAAEYLLQDRLTLVFDIGYRLARIDPDLDPQTQRPEYELTITDTDPADLEDGTTSLERLNREHSYIFHGFFDWGATERAEEHLAGGLHSYGPHTSQLIPLPADRIGIDMSGLQIQVGFRLYFL